MHEGMVVFKNHESYVLNKDDYAQVRERCLLEAIGRAFSEKLMLANCLRDCLQASQSLPTI